MRFQAKNEEDLLKILKNIKNNFEHSSEDVEIVLSEGKYHINDTIKLDGYIGESNRSIKIIGSNTGETLVTGSRGLENLNWLNYQGDILVANIEKGLDIDSLRINDVQYIMARYPSFNPNVEIWNGYSKNAISKEKAKGWNSPEGGYIHAMHSHMWGDFHFKITGKDEEGNLEYIGGWQNNRLLGFHKDYIYVENIFEELTDPGEWYYDKVEGLLYVIPYDNHSLGQCTVEIVKDIKHLFEIKNSQNIKLENIVFTGTSRTFMDNKEQLLRSDWTTYRGGSILFENSNNCEVIDCEFRDLGGNGVYISGDNTGININHCHFENIGANGICFVGLPDSVRSPLFEYNERQSVKDIDMEKGPKSNSYPKDCKVYDCLIHNIGVYEKQSAAVQISMSHKVTVSHCSIYHVPRAGINISEGTFGGHVIEYCDVFDTVKETGDHGSFNSWGRDRYWELSDLGDNSNNKLRELAKLDIVDTNIIRNNRFRCDRGWDIDLDDGSSNYHIYNNLCLNGGIKLREGFHRLLENNITVNNSLHFHVWYENNGDIAKNNIVFDEYKPIGMPEKWGETCDLNVLHKEYLKDAKKCETLATISKDDKDSIECNCIFKDYLSGDYTVLNNRVLDSGFKNFSMNDFGVCSEKLQKKAKKPIMPQPILRLQNDSTKKLKEWYGANLKNIDGIGEMSALGTADENGLVVYELSIINPLRAKGICENDVILKINDYVVNKNTIDNLEEIGLKEEDIPMTEFTIWRKQNKVILKNN